MTAPPILLRPMRAADLPAAHGLSMRLDWPHRLEDWRLFLELGSGLVALDPSGALAGTAMFWSFGARATGIGMVIVAGTHQRQGIGRRLMAAVQAGATTRGLMLNATEAGLGLYESLGFRALGRIRQHQGVFAGAEPDPRVRAARRSDQPTLLALDRAAFGADRRVVLDRLWGAAADCRLIETDGRVSGFAMRREFGRGEIVGPLVAETEADAMALVGSMARPGFLRIDIPAAASAFGEWLTGLGLPAVDTVVAMTRGDWPFGEGPARRFGLASQALG